MINIEELLQPISEEAPCGMDLSYDPAMHEFEELLRGKPETQFSAAEEPRWDHVRDRCVELLHRSKNLRIAVVLCLALLRTEGVTGFRDGLVLLKRLIEQYWSELYPRLDPDDANDPTERVNILAAMLVPLNSFDDSMQFLLRLRQAKLTDSPKVGRFSMDQLVPPGGAPGIDAAQVQAAFRDTPPEKLQALAMALTESTGAASAIDDFLTSTIGASHAPDWKSLQMALTEIKKTVSPFIGQGGFEVVVESAGEGGAPNPMAGAPPAVNGAIQSRQDVARAIDRICDYYSQAEPSSPVPLLLRRAQRLAEMNFLEIITELSPEALAPVQNVTGVRPSDVAGG